ncbi:hypothetical protein MPH_00811 [Macrophomina phaseolina MS6]|uniref:Uncharacterized protein n=1 Tax=Macrophomina phaseolina (strain MS6) TaxID=1126212 RepID=K2RH58_MACPH|nr:hypothetical protein MPH_00811 [Macrophomina phaseolina MS6]
METSLRHNLTKHTEKLHYQIKDRPYLRERSLRLMNLYVLTDGSWWQRCNAAEPIREFVRNLQEQGDVVPHKSPTGIQFISFGNDADNLTYLKYLDIGLGLARDIVDTEPSNRNVWKMLHWRNQQDFDDDLNSVGSSSLDILRETNDFSMSASAERA